MPESGRGAGGFGSTGLKAKSSWRASNAFVAAATSLLASSRDSPIKKQFTRRMPACVLRSAGVESPLSLTTILSRGTSGVSSSVTRKSVLSVFKILVVDADKAGRQTQRPVELRSDHVHFDQHIHAVIRCRFMKRKHGFIVKRGHN